MGLGYSWGYSWLKSACQGRRADDCRHNLVFAPLWGDTIYIKTQVFRLLRYYSSAPRNIARSDWATQNVTHNMTSLLKQPYGVHSY